MSLVATLICNPADPALDSTVVDGARAILPSPGRAQWLFDEVAVDIPFTGSDDIQATCRSTSWCSRRRCGARSFFSPTWTPP
jgi:hypothetical protein